MGDLDLHRRILAYGKATGIILFIFAMLFTAMVARVHQFAKRHAEEREQLPLRFRVTRSCVMVLAHTSVFDRA